VPFLLISFAIAYLCDATHHHYHRHHHHQNLHILAVCPLAGLTRQSGDVFEPRERIKVHVASMMNRMEVNNSLLRLIEYIKQFYPKWKRYASPGTCAIG
jgi:hypothetical protein